jgi:hypothetical protein
MTHTQLKKSWEERFEEKFGYMAEPSIFDLTEQYKDLKSFIHSVLEEQRKEIEGEILAIPFELGTYKQDEFTTIDDMTEIIEQNAIKFFEYRDKILDLLKKETKK